MRAGPFFPLQPQQAEMAIVGWEFTGVHDNGTIDQQVSLRRIKSSSASSRIEIWDRPVVDNASEEDQKNDEIPAAS